MREEEEEEEEEGQVPGAIDDCSIAHMKERKKEREGCKGPLEPVRKEGARDRERARANMLSTYDTLAQEVYLLQLALLVSVLSGGAGL